MVLGFKVSAARKLIKDKAEKNGDLDAEGRYSYPKMYAEGFSNEAKEFNCVQRSHQQALETYPQYLALSLIGGLRFPISSTVCGILWNLARYQVTLECFLLNLILNTTTYLVCRRIIWRSKTEV